MTYDAIIILGRGVYKDGSISDSAKSTVDKAVELFKSGQAPRVIFSGRWTYTLDYTPPKTEAAAMAEYATTLGLPTESIHLEERSYTTATNAYFIKRDLLLPNNWRHLLLISIYPMAERAHFTLKQYFGPEFVCDLVVTDFTFPKDILPEKERSERTKLEQAKNFIAHFQLKPGDHERLNRITNDKLKSFLSETKEQGGRSKE